MVETPSRLVVNGLAQGGASFGQTIEAAVGGAVTASNVTVASNHGFPAAAARVLAMLDTIDSPEWSDRARLVRTADDVVACRRDKVAGIIIGFQNADPIEDQLVYLQVMHRLGLRIMQLTYQRRNLLASGCGEAVDLGLTDYGRDVVAECNRLGVLVDLSHSGPRTTIEAAEASSRPIVISHANLFDLNPIPRNKTFDVIEAVAGTGGLMGVTAISRLITPEGRQRQATVVEYVDQVELVAAKVGIEHVAIGLDSSEGMTEAVFEERQRTFLKDFPELKIGGDFPLWTYFTEGLESAAGIDTIRVELERRGWSAADVGAVLGNNWLRVLRASW